MEAYNIAIKVRNIISLLVFLGLIALVAASCQQHELCYDHNHYSNVLVTYDWQQEKDKPQSMFVYYYPEDGTQFLKRDFAGCMGGKTMIKTGLNHDIVSVNSDNPNLSLTKDMTPQTLTLKTEDAMVLSKLGLDISSLPVAPSSEGMPMRMETGRVWIAATSDRKVFAPFDKECVDTVVLTPTKAFVTYHIIINNVKNPQKITSGIAASLSGLCGSIYPYTGQKTNEKVIVPFVLNLDIEKGVIDGSFTTFGKSLDENIPNKLVIYATLKDGSKWSYVFDVTSQIRKEVESDLVEVNINSLEIPNVPGSSSGMNPGIKGWNVIEIPVKM